MGLKSILCHFDKIFFLPFLWVLVLPFLCTLIYVLHTAFLNVGTSSSSIFIPVFTAARPNHYLQALSFCAQAMLVYKKRFDACFFVVYIAGLGHMNGGSDKKCCHQSVFILNLYYVVPYKKTLWPSAQPPYSNQIWVFLFLQDLLSRLSSISHCSNSTLSLSLYAFTILILLKRLGLPSLTLATCSGSFSSNIPMFWCKKLFVLLKK